MPTVAKVLTTIHDMAWNELGVGVDLIIISEDGRSLEAESSIPCFSVVSSRSCICVCESWLSNI